MKKMFLILALAIAAAPVAAAPSITNVTVWTDTVFTGPYVVSAVIRDASYPLIDTLIRYKFNPAIDDNPASWSDYYRPDSTRGDTMYFHIPAIPLGLETPVKVGYVLWAYNQVFQETYNPGTGYHSFVNTVYTPQFTNVSLLPDTFYNGPFVVKANITTIYGDSVASDSIYSDLLGGAKYPRDSVGADGFYYYAIPRHPGNAQTPVTALWYLAALDTMGNSASFPLKRETFNYFVFTDPLPRNVRTLANTDQTGPFPVWVDYKAEGPVVNDSLWLFNGSDYEPFPRDSVSTGNPSRHYYTIPQQNQPVVTPVSVQWYLKASDGASGNYTYIPTTAPIVPYSFYIYDRTPPVLSNVSALANAVSPGPRTVYADARDTSGVYQIRLYYRTRPNEDTTWQYLPMYATGIPDQYKATLPYIGDGALAQYYVSAVDGAQDEGSILLRNTSYFPAGGGATPWHFFVGSHPYRLLLVNDELPSNEFGVFYTACLDTTGVLYGYWDNRKASALSNLGNFDKLIWFTGNDSLNTLSQADRDSLTAFLDRGGNLLLSSKNLGQNMGDTSVLVHDYLKAQLAGTNVSVPNLVLPGRDAYPLSDWPIDTLRLTTSGTAGNYRSVDRYLPLTGADSVYTFRTVGGCGVIRCSTATYKTVFSSLPLECVGKQTNRNVTRTHFIARCLRWFGMTVFYKVDGEPQPVALGSEFKLLPASPNPFRHTTVISYQTSQSGKVSLKVYNVAGQLVRTLVDGMVEAGRHSVAWNGKDDQGQNASNGIYFYRLSRGSHQAVGKVMIIR
ncbi:MAG: FlgD immunoglobulin-like domain containing protein [Candidatus Edwardsbacteria bacterium]|nr:FlgD immunoglobulin-like domain containing protein [Candidatus Edwardsbacteria bacterium]